MAVESNCKSQAHSVFAFAELECGFETGSPVVEDLAGKPPLHVLRKASVASSEQNPWPGFRQEMPMVSVEIEPSLPVEHGARRFAGRPMFLKHFAVFRGRSEYYGYGLKK